jgi:hypothetical protein
MVVTNGCTKGSDACCQRVRAAISVRLTDPVLRLLRVHVAEAEGPDPALGIFLADLPLEESDLPPGDGLLGLAHGAAGDRDGGDGDDGRGRHRRGGGYSYLRRPQGEAPVAPRTRDRDGDRRRGARGSLHLHQWLLRAVKDEVLARVGRRTLVIVDQRLSLYRMVIRWLYVCHALR